MKYWIFLHHKCASQYLRAVVSAAGQEAGVLTSISALNSMGTPPDHGSVDVAMAASNYSLDDNAWPELPFIIDGFADNWRGLHFIRDPRDLLVSAYFSHKHSHSLESLPGLAAHRDVLLSTDLVSGLIHEMGFYLTDQSIMSILKWSKHPRIKTFDAIGLAREVGRGELAMLEYALDWIDIPVGTEFTAPLWETVAGRGKDIEDNTHHYRHGVQGDWCRYFTPAVEDEFWNRYGRLMRAQGLRR